MRIEEFDYQLPPELVAQHPLPQRAASRLLYLNGAGGQMRDACFGDIVQFLESRDVLIFNDTQVIKARLSGIKQSGGKVEVLVERILTEREILAQVHASHP